MAPVASVKPILLSVTIVALLASTALASPVQVQVQTSDLEPVWDLRECPYICEDWRVEYQDQSITAWTPTTFEDTAVLAHSGAPPSVERVDLTTGESLWRVPASMFERIHSVAVGHVTAVMGAATNGSLLIATFQTADGKFLWSRSLGPAPFHYGGMTVSGDAVAAQYFPDLRQQATRTILLEAADGSLRWSHVTSESMVAPSSVQSLHLADGSLYVAYISKGSTGARFALASYDNESGAQEWLFERRPANTAYSQTQIAAALWTSTGVVLTGTHQLQGGRAEDTYAVRVSLDNGTMDWEWGWDNGGSEFGTDAALSPDGAHVLALTAAAGDTTATLIDSQNGTELASYLLNDHATHSSGRSVLNGRLAWSPAGVGLALMLYDQARQWTGPPIQQVATYRMDPWTGELDHGSGVWQTPAAAGRMYAASDDFALLLKTFPHPNGGPDTLSGHGVGSQVDCRAGPGPTQCKSDAPRGLDCTARFGPGHKGATCA